jgi:glycosyltransferase involved in cell wall biosynthesis
MKIFHPVLCYYPSQAGGPANTVYWLNKTLNTKGIHTNVISTSFGLSEQIKVKKYNDFHKVVFFKAINSLFFKKSIIEIKKTDIVQFSSLFFLPTLVFLLFSVLYNKCIILSPRGELYNAALSQKKYKKYIWLNIIKLFQSKINFHATNLFEKDLIYSHFKRAKSIDIIPNYIEIPIKEELVISNSLVFLGRINPIKNIEVLISSLAVLIKIHPDLKLNIFGEARLDYEMEYLNKLTKQVSKLNLQSAVFFKGHVNGEVKNKMIAASKALLLPSKSENFGNVVLESLAQGTPVIASKGTPWKILENYNAGYWVNDNSKDFVNSLLKLLSLTDNEYKKMRVNAFKLCKEKFDINSNINKWLIYYNKSKKKCSKTKHY